MHACMQGILCCLNAFSGSIFLTVGITHLLSDVLHFQQEAAPGTDYPLGLAIIVLGFVLILFIEQVRKLHSGCDIRHTGNTIRSSWQGRAQHSHWCLVSSQRSWVHSGALSTV